jgi:Holliday junction resolvasome RuvABC endonuclease subunit
VKIVGVDPGYQESGWLIYDSDEEQILFCTIESNDRLLERLGTNLPLSCDVLAIEKAEGFGQKAGETMFDTCFWAGRFVQAWRHQEKQAFRIGRKKVKLHLCGTSSAGDKDVTEALKHRFGQAGAKRVKGPLLGVSSHIWAALGVAITFADQIKEERNGTERTK